MKSPIEFNRQGKDDENVIKMVRKGEKKGDNGNLWQVIVCYRVPLGESGDYRLMPHTGSNIAPLLHYGIGINGSGFPLV
jgi:hypothetical protein